MRQLPSEDDKQDLVPFQTPELGPRQQLFGGLFAAGFFLGPVRYFVIRGVIWK